MIILGIDPGTGRTGWGVIKKLEARSQSQALALSQNLELVNSARIKYIAHGCVITTQEDLMPKRLLILHNSINKIIRKFNPDSIIIELIFFGKNTKTAISVGQARGIVMLAAAEYNIEVFEYTGIAVKHHLSGYGRSDKKDMQKVVRRLLNTNKRKLPFNTKDRGFDDAADALAIAIHHALKSV